MKQLSDEERAIQEAIDEALNNMTEEERDEFISAVNAMNFRLAVVRGLRNLVALFIGIGLYYIIF